MFINHPSFPIFLFFHVHFNLKDNSAHDKCKAYEKSKCADF